MRAIKGGKTLIQSPTMEEKERIKDALTLKNPVYASIKAHSFSKYTNVPEFLMYYSVHGRDMLVPREFQIEGLKVVENLTVSRRELYRGFKWELRDTQQEAYDTWIEKGKPSGFFVIPTGKGKSILGLYLAAKAQQKTLIIVQKDDLVMNWQMDAHSVLGIPKERIGIIKAQKRTIGKQLTIATIQTFCKLSTAELRELSDTFGMIIVDEAHHSSVQSYEFLEYMRPRYVIGLTATPKREDGLTNVFYWRFGGIIYQAKEIGAEDEDIMPIHVKIKESGVRFKAEARYYHGRNIVSGAEAEALLDAGKYLKRAPMDSHSRDLIIEYDDNYNEMVAQDVIAEYKKHKSSVVFFRKKDHLESFMQRLLKCGVPEHHIALFYGNKDIRGIKDSLENKSKRITLATVAKATEGTNIKAWERAFLIHSIKSEKDVTQALGRIRRICEGKQDAVVYDYRHPYVEGMKGHGTSRDKIYKKIKATVEGKKPAKVIGRGFL